MENQDLIYQWQSPTVFREVANRLLNEIGSVDLFRDPKNQFRQEADIAGDFAMAFQGKEPCQVRLCKEDRGEDFELKTGQGVIGFQAVEADQAGRRRGDEYRTKPESSEATLVDMEGEYEEARQAIQRVLGQKADKRYRPAPNIVVLVNLFFYDPPLDCASLTDPWQDSFKSIWLLRSATRLLRTCPSILNLGW